MMSESLQSACYKAPVVCHGLIVVDRKLNLLRINLFLSGGFIYVRKNRVRMRKIGIVTYVLVKIKYFEL